MVLSGTVVTTRPYDRWDVWANETYFDDTERCSLYGKQPWHNEKKYERDAGWVWPWARKSARRPYSGIGKLAAVRH